MIWFYSDTELISSFYPEFVRKVFVKWNILANFLLSELLLMIKDTVWCNYKFSLFPLKARTCAYFIDVSASTFFVKLQGFNLVKLKVENFKELSNFLIFEIKGFNSQKTQNSGNRSVLYNKFFLFLVRIWGAKLLLQML